MLLGWAIRALIHPRSTKHADPAEFAKIESALDWLDHDHELQHHASR